MKNIIKKTKAFLADEKGAETVEWVIIAAFLAGIILAAIWGGFQGDINTALTSLGTLMTSAGTAP